VLSNRGGWGGISTFPIKKRPRDSEGFDARRLRSLHKAARVLMGFWGGKKEDCQDFVVAGSVYRKY